MGMTKLHLSASRVKGIITFYCILEFGSLAIVPYFTCAKLQQGIKHQQTENSKACVDEGSRLGSFSLSKCGVQIQVTGIASCMAIFKDRLSHLSQIEGVTS